MTEASNSLPNDGLLNEVNEAFSGLTLALSKGRILEETMPLLRAAGVELLEDPEASRKLIFPTSNPNVRVLILRASDVPTYVEHGAADFGVAGKDVLLEHGAKYAVFSLKAVQLHHAHACSSSWRNTARLQITSRRGTTLAPR